MKGPMIIRIAAGVLIGGLAGYGLYRFVGCSSGACPITSNPWVSCLYGAILGLVISMGGRN